MACQTHLHCLEASRKLLDFLQVQLARGLAALVRELYRRKNTQMTPKHPYTTSVQSHIGSLPTGLLVSYGLGQLVEGTAKFGEAAISDSIENLTKTHNNK